MDQSQSTKESLNRATNEDIRRLFRQLDDHTVASVLALKPAVAQAAAAPERRG